MLGLLLAVSIGSSLGDSGIAPAVAATSGGPYFSGSVTNTTYPVTNAYGMFGANISVTNGQQGQQFTITPPSNYVVTGFENYTPEVSDFVNGETVYKTPGRFRYNLKVQDANGVAKGCSGSFAVSLVSGSGTVWSFSNYVAGTFGYDLLTNLVARTNAGRDGVLWDSINSTGWSWHTNSLLYGVTGYTGLSQMSSFGGGFPWKFTAITKRHAYSAGHVFGAGTTNGYVYFVGTDGSTSSMFVSDCRQRFNYTSGFDDYCIVFFTNDLPATVSPLKVCFNTNALYKFPLGKLSGYPIPLLETCQHGRVGSQGLIIFDNHGVHAGGDSGNPCVFIIGNELVNYQGTSGTLLGTNFMNDLNAMTINAGLNTNNYQPVLYDTSAYPFYYP